MNEQNATPLEQADKVITILEAGSAPTSRIAMALGLTWFKARRVIDALYNHHEVIKTGTSSGMRWELAPGVTRAMIIARIQGELSGDSIGEDVHSAVEVLPVRRRTIQAGSAPPPETRAARSVFDWCGGATQ